MSPAQQNLAGRKKTALVVTGMHRSGTSAMARVLSLHGAQLPQDLMPAAAGNNPHGFWEPVSVVSLNERLLGQLDTSWSDPFGLPGSRITAGLFDRFVGEAAETIAASFQSAETIVLKEPRMALLLPVWEKALSLAGYQANYIVMVRHPLEVAASLRVRDGFTDQHGVLLWSGYMLHAERDTRNAPRVFVSFDRLIENTGSVVDDIEDAFGRVLIRSNKATLESDAFVNGELRHHAARSKTLEGHRRLWPGAENLHDWLKASAQGEQVDTGALDSAWNEYRNLERSVGIVFVDYQQKLSAATRASAAERKRREASAAELVRLQSEMKALRQLADERDKNAEEALSARQKLNGFYLDLIDRFDELDEQHTRLIAERDTLAAFKTRTESKAAARAQLEAAASKPAPPPREPEPTKASPKSPSQT